MRVRNYNCWAFALLLIGAACGDDGETKPFLTADASASLPGASSDPAGAAAGGGGTQGAMGGAGAPGAGPGGPVDAGSTPGTPLTDSGSGPGQAGGAGSDAGAGGGEAGLPALDDAATAEGGAPGTPADLPEPVENAYVWGVGVGVGDMQAAVKFYTEVMKMTVEKENQERGDRTETVLYAAEARRGSRLVLMKYNDGRPTRNITAKLVWQSPDPGAINRTASSYPDYKQRLAFLVYQFDGPDTYIQEVGSSFDNGGSGIKVPYLVALGFSTSDLTASRKFYTDAIGMQDSLVGTFQVTDATGSGSITEYQAVYKTGGGSALVLQSWSPKRNSKDNPVKIVLGVPDAKAAAAKIAAAGGSMVADAARSPIYDNRLLIVMKDPDGYLIELVE